MYLLYLCRRATVADPFNAKSWVKKGSVLSDLGRNDEVWCDATLGEKKDITLRQSVCVSSYNNEK